ncbi:DUF3667 domain-containing protein [Allomuricauda sp. d1]|uniref:DUF3667 domain-containing protein n=1 Tax=Allomuricauda sp. d1 TaxID=3136725 RepID=UPI0031D29D59
MQCKNCNSSLRSDFGYCPVCGAKVIRNRLTLKNVWHDLSFQVFNLDNTLFKTLKHLLSKPALVAETYISGARKKYMNPISFFAIAVTLSGIMFWVLKDIYGLKLMEQTNQNFDGDKIFKYQALLSYFSVPFYALSTFLVFIDIRKYNFTEHLVIALYIVGAYSFVQVFVSILLFGLFDLSYFWFTNIFIVAILLYWFYTLKKLHHIKFWNTLVRLLLFLPMYFISAFIPTMAIMIFMLISGEYNLQDFAPKN